MQITSKSQFIDLYLAGVLGNRFQIWRDYKEAMKVDILDIGFRELGSGGGGKFEMVLHNQIESTAKRWINEGRKFYLNASDSQETCTIQGEIQYRLGWEGYIGLSRGLKMRDAMNAGYMKSTSGASTRSIMNIFMDDNSRNDVDEILDLYPEAVIEFGCYNREVGILLARNTIIWEVRNY